jgi:glycogen debranching enzyme
MTLVEGTSFCISSPTGDIHRGTAQGLFYRDTRFLSRWELTVNGGIPQPLSVVPHEPFAASFLSRVRPHQGQADSTLLVVRRRFVGSGMREDLVVRNLAREPAACSVLLSLEADFAHLFEVKEDRVSPKGEPEVEMSGRTLTYRLSWLDSSRALQLSVGEEVLLLPGMARLQVVVPARGEWSTCFQVCLSMDGEPVPPRYRCSDPVERSKPATRLRAWRRKTPSITTDHESLNALVTRSEEDLGALRIFQSDHTNHGHGPGGAVIAAGAPWYMTLFGRDSLITSWMTLPVDPTVAVGTLLTLARFQGQRVDQLSEEEPGRILHEMRWGVTRPEETRAGDLYYGTADATPLFVMVLGELRRWGLADSLVDRLLPHADRALEWVEKYGDRDGDGFVEYQRATDRGLVNQGWKDSWDAINFASGRLAEPPIALCEVQGYVYAAYMARAHFAREANDAETERHYREKAARLKAAFNRQFWLEDKGYPAVGLDGEKRPIDSLTSNIGHCLWTGILDPPRARKVAARLMSDDMFTGWGVRTLASSMGAYNPVSYHNGSVWPHDSAIVAAGLMRYGFVPEAQRIALGLIEASEAFEGRLPELFCGFGRSEFSLPVRYPTSGSPQAWAAATPFSLLRTLLRLDPWIPRLQLCLAPALPPELGAVKVLNVPLAGTRIAIEVKDGKTSVSGLPSDIQVLAEPRQPLHG